MVGRIVPPAKQGERSPACRPGVLQLLLHAAAGVDLNEKTKKKYQKEAWKSSPGRMRLKKKIRSWPDGLAEKFVASFDSYPVEMRKLLKDAIASMPKPRGGRPTIPLEERKQIINEVSEEHKQGSIGRAIETVARRRGKEPHYVRGVWKNRTRLKSL